MPPGAGQDQWEDVTPGPVINAGAARAQKSGDDEWEDVGPSQKKDFAPGSYQTKPGAPIQNAKDLATPYTRVGDAARGVLSAVGIGPAKPGESLAQSELSAGRQLTSGVGRSVSQANEEAGRMTGEGRYGPAALAMTPINLEAHGAEAIASGLEHGGEDIFSGDPERMAHGAGEVGMNILPVAELGPRNLRELATDVKDTVGRAARIEPTVDNTSTRGNLAEPKRFSTLKPGVKAVASVAKMVGGPEVVNAVIPEHPVKIGPFSRLSDRVPVPEPEMTPAEKEFADTQYMTEKQEAAAAENQKFDRKAKADALREAKSKVTIAGEVPNTPQRTGSEGRAATWTNEDVQRLAAKGNRDAISQLARRGLPLPENLRYVMGDIDMPRVVNNPREVTRFNPDGTPIRDVNNPIAQNPSSRARIQIVGEQPGGKTSPSPQTPIDFGALPTPGRSLPQVEHPVAVGTAKSSTPIPTAEDLEEAFRSKGRSGVDSFNLAKQTIQEATSGDVPDGVRTQALERIKRVMGPDTRAAGEPLAVGKNEPLAPGTEVLHHFPNPEHGTEAVVAKTSQGYSAVLRDTDSGNTLPQARIFKTEQEAIDYGKSLAKGTSPKYGKPVELGKPTEPAKPLNGKQVQLAKMEDRPAPERTARTRAPIEKLENFDEDTLANAKAELEEANGKWQTFERPGRYVHDVNFEPGDLTHKPDVQAYGVPSARPDLEAAHPWLKNLPKMTAEKLRTAIESGKGVEYTRLLNEAGRHVQAAKLRNGPIIEEYGDRLEEAAKSAESVDPDLARTLRDIKAGKFSALGNLRTYVERTLKDADSAAAFDKALGELSQEELRESAPESSGRGDQPRETNQQAVKLGPPVLPGMEQAVEENKASAAVELGKKLTQKINEPRSIESAAGEMESKSPLFRGTGASPQNEMFQPGGAAKPQEIVESAGAKFVGVQKMYGTRPDQVLFQATDGGSTLAVDADKVTPEAIRKKIAESGK